MMEPVKRVEVEKAVWHKLVKIHIPMFAVNIEVNTLKASF